MEKTKKILVEKLKAVYDDRDFILGVISAVRSLNGRKKIIDYIDNGTDVTDENIILLSLTLSEQEEYNLLEN